MSDSEIYSLERCREVTFAVEKFLREMSRFPSEVLDGLADRPKPGQKALARKAYVELLKQICELRKIVEMSRPLNLTTSSAQVDCAKDPGGHLLSSVID